jgi:hypothetical protein
MFLLQSPDKKGEGNAAFRVGEVYQLAGFKGTLMAGYEGGFLAAYTPSVVPWFEKGKAGRVPALLRGRRDPPSMHYSALLAFLVIVMMRPFFEDMGFTLIVVFTAPAPFSMPDITFDIVSSSTCA